MITEKGAITATGEMNKRVMLQALKLTIIAVVLLSVACIFLMLGEILYIVEMGRATGHIATGLLFWVAIIFIIVSIVVAVKKAANGKRYEYEFYQSYVKVSAFDKVSGEKFAVRIVEYRSIFRVKETKDYLLFYPSQTEIFPVDKKGLTTEELNVVKQLLRRKINTTNSAFAPVSERETPIYPATEDLRQEKPKEKFDVFEEFSED